MSKACKQISFINEVQTQDTRRYTMQVIPNSSAEQYAKSENVSYSYLDGSGNEKDPFAWLS